MRSILGITVLSALVLGITLGIRATYNLNTLEVAQISNSILGKLGVPVKDSRVGEVAGKFVERISQTDIGMGVSTIRTEEASASASDSSSKDVKFKVAVFSDIHEDTQNLSKALDLAISNKVAAIFILGDLTNFGDIPTLQMIKKQLDASGVTYYTIPGDHDIAQTSSLENFSQVFGSNYQKVALDGYTFLLVDNSPNYTKLPPVEISWIDNNITSADYIFLSQPLFVDGLNPPFNRMYMGSTQSAPETDQLKQKQLDVRDQGTLLLGLIRDTKNVKAVIAGDQHMSSELADSKRADLKHYVVGAITDKVDSYPQKIIQSSRISILNIYTDGTYDLNDLPLN